MKKLLLSLSALLLLAALVFTGIYFTRFQSMAAPQGGAPRRDGSFSPSPRPAAAAPAGPSPPLLLPSQQNPGLGGSPPLRGYRASPGSARCAPGLPPSPFANSPHVKMCCLLPRRLLCHNSG